MKLVFVLAVAALLLQGASSAPHRSSSNEVSIQDLLRQLQRTKLVQEQQTDYGAEEQQDYAQVMQDYGELQQDYGQEQQINYDLFAKEMQDYGELQQDYGQEQQDYGELQQDYGELQQDYGELQQDYNGLATLQDDFDAAVQGWWDRIRRWGSWLYSKAKAGCRLINRGKRDAESQYVPIGTILKTGASLVKGACRHIAKPSATVEGFLGFSFNDFKNAAKKAFNLAKSGCRKYKSSSLLRSGAKRIAGNRAQYLDTVCKGLSSIGGRQRQAAIQMILNHALRTSLQQAEQARYEEKLGRAFLQSFAN